HSTGSGQPRRMDDERDIITVWIAREIVPHEAALRVWFARRWRNAVDVEDVIQEAYCRIAGLASVDHINNPAGYFHRTAHAVATDMMLRAGKINLVALSHDAWSDVIDHGPLADRVMEAEQEPARVNGLLCHLCDTGRGSIEVRAV